MKVNVYFCVINKRFANIKLKQYMAVMDGEGGRNYL